MAIGKMAMNEARFVTGTGTDVGKTIVSALLALRLGANYFKPIQSGSPTDADFMRDILGAKRVFEETYRLEKPLSPNQAAACDNRVIDLVNISISEKLVAGPLIVEGAGGILSPLNDSQTIIDLILALKLPTILVARSSLGTITHTLQSVEILKDRGIVISCIILFGRPHQKNHDDIEKRTLIKTINHSDIKHLNWKDI